jgi:hypothetical protein
MSDKVTSLPDKLRTELNAGLLILFKLKENKVDYSITNRPEPTLSGVSDHALATAIVFAGQNFSIRRTTKEAQGERISRIDGRTVTYHESIELDWKTNSIVSTRGRELTLKILSLVVQNLMRSAIQQVNPTKTN